MNQTAEPPETTNRIFFPGNPWPQGHAIISMLWDAYYKPGAGFWFNFYLMSADYWADDKISREDVDEDLPDWESVSAWSNYGSCVIDGWGYGGTGFVAFGPGERFDFDALAFKRFHVDPSPKEVLMDPSFRIYLQGHDDVADHHIRFGARQPDNHFSLEWSGKIALTYSGNDDTFCHEFHARFDRLSLGKVYLPANSEQEAREFLQAQFREPECFEISPVMDAYTYRNCKYTASLK